MKEGDARRPDGAQANVGRSAADSELGNSHGNDPGQRRLRNLEEAGRVEDQLEDRHAHEPNHIDDADYGDGVDSLHSGPAGNGAVGEAGGR